MALPNFTLAVISTNIRQSRVHALIDCLGPHLLIHRRTIQYVRHNPTASEREGMGISMYVHIPTLTKVAH